MANGGRIINLPSSTTALMRPGLLLRVAFSLLVGSTGPYHTHMGFLILICVAVMIFAGPKASNGRFAASMAVLIVPQANLARWRDIRKMNRLLYRFT